MHRFISLTVDIRMNITLHYVNTVRMQSKVTDVLLTLEGVYAKR